MDQKAVQQILTVTRKAIIEGKPAHPIFVYGFNDRDDLKIVFIPSKDPAEISTVMFNVRRQVRD